MFFSESLVKLKESKKSISNTDIMKLPSICHPKISQLWVKHSQSRPDPNSLQFRLTVGIATVSAVGLGSLSLYTSMKMYQQLIYTHKQNIQYVAHRFPRNVETYSQQLPLEIRLQHAIDNRNTKNLFLWVKTADGNMLAKSAILAVDRQEYTALISIDNQEMAPEYMPSMTNIWQFVAGH